MHSRAECVRRAGRAGTAQVSRWIPRITAAALFPRLPLPLPLPLDLPSPPHWPRGYILLPPFSFIRRFYGGNKLRANEPARGDPRRRRWFPFRGSFRGHNARRALASAAGTTRSAESNYKGQVEYFLNRVSRCLLREGGVASIPRSRDARLSPRLRTSKR